MGVGVGVGDRVERRDWSAVEVLAMCGALVADQPWIFLPQARSTDKNISQVSERSYREKGAGPNGSGSCRKKRARARGL